VIMLALDKQRETYVQFVVCRFFRLFPVFIVLLVVAIPLSQVSLWNVIHASQYVTPDQIEFRIANVESWWANIQWNTPLHLLMLHGAVPDVLVKDAPEAFLIPAWSISLEWQFYLVAPLVYAWAVSAKPYRRLGLCALCVLLVLAARHVVPAVEYGAALPFQVKLFFLGAASYFFYQRQAAHQLSDIAFPVACCLAVFLFGLSGRAWSLIPIGLWMAFLGLLLEQPSSLSSRLVTPLLTNPIMLYQGRISYSLYLSHILVIIVIQYALLTWVPDLSQMAHLGVLLAGTTAVIIAVSSVLYCWLEVPRIHAVMPRPAGSPPDGPSVRRTRGSSSGGLGTSPWTMERDGGRNRDEPSSGVRCALRIKHLGRLGRDVRKGDFDDEQIRSSSRRRIYRQRIAKGEAGKCRADGEDCR
jgi:peptidoglycan/LPS O-acetylase OafA/YrhL